MENKTSYIAPDKSGYLVNIFSHFFMKTQVVVIARSAYMFMEH